MPATFTQRFQVRFDECAPDGTARAAALLRYVVETAFGHSAHERFPLGWYDAHGLYWLVRRAHLDLQSPLPYGTVFDVTTDVLGFHRILARRRNTVRDTAGTPLALITMDWIFTDRQGNPARVVPEMAATFPGVSERLEVERLEVGDPPVGASPFDYSVPPHELDPRGHMNSAAYIDIFEDVLAGKGVNAQTRPVAFELEYQRAALPGERLRRFIWKESGGWAMLAATDGGAPVVKARWTPGTGTRPS